MEAIQVLSTPPARIVTAKGKETKRKGIQAKSASPTMRHVTNFTDCINKEINASLSCLLRSKSEMLQLEEGKQAKRTTNAEIVRQDCCPTLPPGEH
jgi:hypothetical protein